jgi:hypothetical protein
MVAVLILCLVISTPRVLSASNDEARTAVATADGALRAAFESVQDSEKAGANVSGLISRLNDAGVALTSAETALQMGNYSDSLSNAASCKTLAESIASDAVKLKEESSLAGSWPFLINLFVLPYAVAGVFVVVLLLVWSRFKRSYNRKLLKSRPGVT